MSENEHQDNYQFESGKTSSNTSDKEIFEATLENYDKKIRKYARIIDDLQRKKEELQIDKRNKAINNMEKPRENFKEKIVPKARKKGDTIHPQMRERIKETLKNKSWKETMEIFNISKGSVFNIMHEETDIVPPIKQRGGIPSIFDAEYNNILLLEWLEKDPRITQKKLAEKFVARGLHTSGSSVGRALHHCKITWKSSFQFPTRWNDATLKLQRKNFVMETLQLSTYFK